MKVLAIAWVFLVAVAVGILGIWFVVNSVLAFPAVIMLVSAAELFALGVMLTKEGPRW